MDQFNKVLAAFLILIVAVGLSIFIFARLGVLNRIIPSTSPEKTVVVVQTSPTPTPVKSPTPTPKEAQGLLGWFSQLGKARNNTPTPKKIDPTTSPTTRKEMLSAQNIDSPTIAPATPAVTIIPYGATSVSTYPASGPETALIPIFTATLLIGLYIRRRSV